MSFLRKAAVAGGEADCVGLERAREEGCKGQRERGKEGVMKKRERERKEVSGKAYIVDRIIFFLEQLRVLVQSF